MPSKPKPKGPPPCQPVKCKSCIFGDTSPITEYRLAEIVRYLLKGTTHLCHSRPSRGPRKLACRGGRNIQLKTWHAMGLIEEPTDEALAAAMKALDL